MWVCREKLRCTTFGMDPGIDLVLLGEAVRSLDHVEEIISRRVNYDRSHL